jgi:hypothetical protein
LTTPSRRQILGGLGLMAGSSVAAIRPPIASPLVADVACPELEAVLELQRQGFVSRNYVLHFVKARVHESDLAGHGCGDWLLKMPHLHLDHTTAQGARRLSAEKLIECKGVCTS